MPGGDGTGPGGLGPMTGRRAGYCAGYSVPGYMNPVGGYGAYGRGRGGGGRGRRYWYYQTGMPGWSRASYGYPAWGGYAPPRAPYRNMPVQAPAAEMDMLKQEADYLSEELNAIQERLDALKKEKEEES
jgi:hypothetical protein